MCSSGSESKWEATSGSGQRITKQLSIGALTRKRPPSESSWLELIFHLYRHATIFLCEPALVLPPELVLQPPPEPLCRRNDAHSRRRLHSALFCRLMSVSSPQYNPSVPASEWATEPRGGDAGLIFGGSIQRWHCSRSLVHLGSVKKSFAVVCVRPLC